MVDRPRVLVVDDNIDLAENIADVLSIRDYDVDVASDGQAAIDAVIASPPDLVLMDVRMPGLDGVSSMEKIKEIAPDVPVIMMTAYETESVLEDALRQGAFGWVRKPLNLDRLSALIQTAQHPGGLLLLVDDNVELSENLRQTLSEYGYNVTVAGDGLEALERVQECRFDVILLDMRLPLMDGRAVCQRLPAIRPDTVVIAITGYPEETRDPGTNALRRPIYACLVKPIDLDELLSLVKRHAQRTVGDIPNGSPEVQQHD